MNNAVKYVSYFYQKYTGRIALGAGYQNDLSEIYPLVFQSSTGDAIGIIAIGVVHETLNTVHIFHIGSFFSQNGNGAAMLNELCTQADIFEISLSVSPIAMQNGTTNIMNSEELETWYKKYGFVENEGLIRPPDVSCSR